MGPNHGRNAGSMKKESPRNRVPTAACLGLEFQSTDANRVLLSPERSKKASHLLGSGTLWTTETFSPGHWASPQSLLRESAAIQKPTDSRRGAEEHVGKENGEKPELDRRAYKEKPP